MLSSELARGYTYFVGRVIHTSGKELAMAAITVEMPEFVLAVLHSNPEEFADEMRLAAATWYGQGKVSQEVAARIAGLDRTDFLLALARMGHDSFSVDFADLDKELVC